MDFTTMERQVALRQEYEEQLGDLLLARGHLDRQIDRLRSRLAVLPMGRNHRRGGSA